MQQVFSQKRALHFLVAYTCFHLLVNSLYVDVWRSANQISRVCPAIGIVKNGNMRIDPYAHLTVDKSLINGHYYSDKPPMPSFLLVPALWALDQLPTIRNLPEETYLNLALMLGNLLLGILPFVGLVVLSFRSIQYRPNAPLIASLPFYGSFLFIGSGTSGAHLFSAFLAVMAYVLIKRKRYFWAGICVSLIFGTEYQLLLLFALVGLVLLWKSPTNWKNIAGLLWGTLPGIGIILWHNYGLTGDPLVFPYKYFALRDAAITEGYALRLPSLTSIFHLSFSDYRGLFFYAPFLVFFLYHFWGKVSLRMALRHLLFWPLFLFFVYIASLDMWYAGWTVGPRYLMAPAALCLFMGILHYQPISFRQTHAQIFVALGIVAATLFFLIKGTVLYNFPDRYMHPLVEVFWPALSQGAWNNGNVVWFLMKDGSEVALVLLFIIYGIGSYVLNRYHHQLVRKH